MTHPAGGVRLQPDQVVMKFGGTSVADPDAIARLIDIVRRQIQVSATSQDTCQTCQTPVVVVSALSGVTDALVAIARLAEDGEGARAASELHALLESAERSADA